MQIKFLFSPDSQPIILEENQILAYCSDPESDVRTLDEGVMEAIVDLIFEYLSQEQRDILECKNVAWVRERLTIMG